MIGQSRLYALTLKREPLEDLVRWLEVREEEKTRQKKRKSRVAGGTSHDGAQRRGGDKAPGAGIQGPKNRGQPSNGPEIQGETHHPLVQGENQEATSPTEAPEKEATEVSIVQITPCETLSSFVLLRQLEPTVILF